LRIVIDYSKPTIAAPGGTEYLTNQIYWGVDVFLSFGIGSITWLLGYFAALHCSGSDYRIRHGILPMLSNKESY
jgi:hypothetical protein